MPRSQIAVEIRRSLYRAAIPLAVLLLVLFNWSLPRGAGAVEAGVGYAVYRIGVQVGLLILLAAVVIVAVRPPHIARQWPIGLAVAGFAVASAVAAVIGGFFTFYLGA